MKRAHSLLQSFEYFCQISSKLILKILCYIVPKFGHFLRQSIGKRSISQENLQLWRGFPLGAGQYLV